MIKENEKTYDCLQNTDLHEVSYVGFEELNRDMKWTLLCGPLGGRSVV